MAEAGYRAGELAGLSPIGRLLCAAFGAALPEIVQSIGRPAPYVGNLRIPTAAELDDVLKKLGSKPPTGET